MFFKKNPVSIYLIEQVEGEKRVVEVDTDTTMSDAYGKVQQITFGLVGGKITSQDQEHIVGEGFTEEGAKVEISAYDNRILDGSIEL